MSRLTATFDLGVGEIGRPEWHLQANCRGVGADKFFGQVVTEETLALCERCSVQTECAKQGASELHGSWGGRLQREQRLPKAATVRPRKMPKPPKPQPGYRARAERPPCGTESGYRRHRRAGEVPCVECVDAHSATTREWKRRARVRRRAARAVAA